MKKILLLVSVLAVIALGVLNMTYQESAPDEVFPIANHGIWN